MLPKSCVFRNRKGEYLATDGTMTRSKNRAVVVDISVGPQVLVVASVNELSMEELSKHERKKHAPLTDVETNALIATLHVHNLQRDVSRYAAEAERLERLARWYREEADRLAAVACQYRKKAEKQA